MITSKKETDKPGGPKGDTERLYSTGEVEERLGISRSNTTRFLEKRGIHPTIKARGKSPSYYDAEQIDELVKSYKGAAGEGGELNHPRQERKGKANLLQVENYYTTQELAERLGVHFSYVPDVMKKFGVEPQRVGTRNVYSTELSDAAVEKYLAGKKGEKPSERKAGPQTIKGIEGKRGYSREEIANLFGIKHLAYLSTILSKEGVSYQQVGNRRYYDRTAVDALAASRKGGEPGAKRALKKAGTKRVLGARAREKKAKVAEAEPQILAYEFAGISYDSESNRFILGISVDANDALEPLEMRLKESHPDIYRDAILEAVKKAPDVALSYLMTISAVKKKV
jgi:transposase